MRFLENLVSDMVKESTGFNPRRVIRMIGGKNLLMAGAGAVLAGTLANAGRGHGAGGQVASRTMVPPTGGAQAPLPPLPPLPGAPAAPHAGPPPLPGSHVAAAPPPLPPLPVTEARSSQPVAAAPEKVGTEDRMSEEDPGPEVTFAIVRTMVAAALADGHLSPQEKATIQGRLGESNLAPEQVRQIHQDLVLPPSLAELAAMTDDAEVRETLFRFAALVVVTDQQLSDLERAWLDGLATTFALSADRQRSLEQETLGVLQQAP